MDIGRRFLILVVLAVVALCASLVVVAYAPAQSCTPRILVVAGAAPAPSGDSSFVAAVESVSPGCVTTIADDAVTVVDAESFDVVVITSSVNPATLGDRLRDAAVPILVSESYLFDDMAFVGPGKGRDYGSQSTIRITNPGHPLAGGWSFTVAIYESDAALGIGFDSGAPGLIPIATANAGSPRLTVFGFEAGSEMMGMTAPAGRVGFFATYRAELTYQGVGMVNSAIHWLLGQPGAANPDPDRDAVPSVEDVCPVDFDVLQFDTDLDGVGDACDATPVTPSAATFVAGDDALGVDNGNDVGLADFDFDGDLDAFVANNGEPDSVWTNDGSGGFTNSGQALGSFNSKGLAIGDVDDDGDFDVFVAHVNQPDRVWVNDGAGIFTDSGQALGSESSQNAAFGDLDGDGDLDAYTANFSGPDQVWLNDGAGLFTAGQAIGTAASQGATLGDIDDDGDLDAVVAASGTTKVWLNDGMATFSDSGEALAGSFQSRRPALGDVDNDGDADVVITTDADVETLWLNDGSGSFTMTQSLGTTGGEHASLGDLDGDGDLDLFFASRIVPTGRPNHVWLNDGAGTFSDSGQRLGNARSNASALGDVDGDGDLDAFVANTLGTPDQVWLNETIPTENPQAVMISGNTSPPSGDRVMRDRVLAAGFELTVVDDDSNLGLLDLSQVDLLLISSSVVPYKVGDTFKNTPLPIIIWEGYLFDDMGLSNSGETSTSYTQLVISNSDHPVAAGLGNGPATVYTSANRLSHGRPGPDAQIVAHAPGRSDQSVVFAYLTGDQLVTGEPAAAPRIALFPDYTGARSLNANGVAIVDAALAYAIDPGEPEPVPPVDGDAIVEPLDNCPHVDGEVLNFNILQIDTDGDGIGDPCDGSPTTPSDGTFVRSPWNPRTDAFTKQVELADINGDGHLDAILVNGIFGGFSLQLLSGDGAGQFTGQFSALPGLAASGASDVAFGDLDGDGDLDAFVANTGFSLYGGPLPKQDFILFNDGLGGFGEPAQELGDERTSSVELGDIDGDDDLDAIVSTQDVHRIWWNGGSGTFANPTDFGIGGPALLGDVDADGDLDLVSQDTSGPGVWLNDGRGQYTFGDMFGGEGNIAGLEDLDGDGDLDGYINSPTTALDRILLNDGLGDFTEIAQTLISSTDVTFGDFDGDGDLDVAAADGNGLKILANDGTAAFTVVDAFTNPELAGWTSPMSIAPAAGDIDSNGTLDLYLGLDSGDDEAGLGDVALLNVDSTPPTFISTGQDFGTNQDGPIALGFLDGDDTLDAFFGNYGSEVWLNDGNASFSDTGQALGADFAREIVLADVDGNDTIDALVAGSGVIWLNDGTATFADSGTGLGSGSTVEFVDIDGNDTIDAVAGNTIWINDGTGVFTDSGQDLRYFVPGPDIHVSPQGTTHGDFDNDGDHDLALAFDADRYGLFGGGVQVWLNDGSGAFTGSPLIGDATNDVSAADLNGDGDIDLVTAAEVLVGDGSGAFSLASGLGELGRGVALADLDNDSDIDVFQAGSASFVWTNDGGANFAFTGNDYALSRDVALGDLDADGDIDAFLGGDHAGEPAVLLNDTIGG